MKPMKISPQMEAARLSEWIDRRAGEWCGLPVGERTGRAVQLSDAHQVRARLAAGQMVKGNQS